MTKSSYLSSFLIFLLLISLSLSEGFSIPSRVKEVFNKLRTPRDPKVPDPYAKALERAQKAKEKIDDASDILDLLLPKFNEWKKNKNNATSEERSALPEKIKGLSLIKNYFSNYGYIESSGKFNDYFDKETASAFTTYQKYFNLQVTGDLSNQTLEQLSFLRCGVPDVNFDYNFTDDVSYPKAGHRWFANTNLTYGFLPENQITEEVSTVFRDSFTRWARATGILILRETAYDKADIQIGFYNFTKLGINDEVYGGSLVVSSEPDSNKTAMILLDETKFWALPSESKSLSWEYGVLDLESVAMHQIGHVLGLDHSSMNESVMHPYILPSHQRKVLLSNSDKDNIYNQYAKDASSKDASSSAGRMSGVVLVTTFSFGLACLLLLF